LSELSVRYEETDLLDEEAMKEIVKKYWHVVILSPQSGEDEKDDMKTALELLRLRDLRARHGLRFNITASMEKGRNQQLVVSDDHTDFVAASNLSALFLAQMAENPQLHPMFSELLSNEGNEILLMKAKK